MADPAADTPEFWRISGNIVDPLARRIRPATLTISSATTAAYGSTLTLGTAGGAGTVTPVPPETPR